MANPTYSMDNSSFTTLPGAYLYGGEPYGYKDDMERQETENGAVSVLVMSRRRHFLITFRVTFSQLATFGALDTLTTGEALSFYFSLTGAGSSDSVLVRNIAKFKPKELPNPVKSGGSKTTMYDVTMELLEEIV